MFDYIINKKINLSEESILEKLLDRKRWPKNYLDGQPSVEAIKEDGTKHQNFFDQDNYLNSLQCIQCYEEGYSLILSNIGGLTQDIWLIENYLKKIYPTKDVNCNLYLGNGKKSVSFNKHYHDYFVLVKNIYGNSTWIINEEKKVLKDQNCFWFDKQTDHQVVEINDAKLSLTCNITEWQN